MSTCSRSMAGQAFVEGGLRPLGPAR